MFGYERKEKTWDLGDGRVLVCTYGVSHFYFLLRWIENKQWFVIGDRRSEDQQLSKEQVAEIFHPGAVPRISAYF